MIISHRGNLQGPCKETENSIEAINECIECNFDIELDIWYQDDKFYLGHDYPQIEFDLRNFDFGWSKVFYHCKDLKTLNKFVSDITFSWERFDGQFDYFFHDKDDAALTANGYIWTYPGKELYEFSITVLPEKVNTEYLNYVINLYKNKKIQGVCSDFPLNFTDSILEF